MEPPSFGVLPDGDEVREVVEFDHLGHRVLGIEYASGTDVVGDTCCVVQLRTPVVPTFVLTAQTGALQPERFTPLEDAKLTKNVISSPRPRGAVLATVEPGVDLYKRFSVSSSDPEFATAVLAGAKELLTTDPWLRVRSVVFHDGSLWTGQSGHLTKDVLYTNACHLARFAAVVPADAWQDPEFAELARTVDTSDAAWGRRGVVGGLNRRRRAADRQPVTARSLVIRTVFALALVLLGLPLIGNGLASLTGLAPEVRLKVTEAFDATDEDANDMISGTYVEDGVTHTITDSYWSTFGDLPPEGDAINVDIGPFWWGPMIEAPDTAVMMILLGLVPVLPGLMLARRTYLPRPPRRADDEPDRE